ncbi:mechanosensitive ion channel [Deinococcus sp.]|uniref:mechanosensitive ion channel n=1 Tax=Deinococcus sp. TaxID=47478 RepID=UPI003C79E0E6
MDIMTGYFHQLTAYVPSVVAALIIFVVALVVAAVARTVVVRLLRAARVDERLTRDPSRPTNLSKPAGDIVYFLVLLLFLPAVLANLGLTSMLAPATGLITTLVNALPRVIGAALILYIGLFIARLLRGIVEGLASSLDGYGARLGLSGTTRLSSLLGLLVFILILLPVISASLSTLGLPAIGAPIQNLIDRFLAFIPSLISAVLVVAIAYFVARLVAQLVAGLLAGVGFDRLPTTLGLSQGGAPLRTPPSQIAGTVVLVAIVLFASVEALKLLGFVALSLLVGQFIVLAGHILLGLLILVVGVYLSTLFAGLVAGNGGSQSRLLASAVRVATLVLFGAMALQQMGIASNIVNLAFGLTLGALAVAFALAFGLGGREAAAKVAEGWRENLQKRE